MKVLIVEDNPDFLNLVSLTLRKEKFSVDFAEEGDTAFEKAKNNKYDLIVLDMHLPKKSGFFIISALRTIGNDTPILAISADKFVESRVRAINMGADDFLVKDFAFEEFTARVKGLVRRKNEHRTNIFRCGSLCVNINNMSVLLKNESLDFTKKEFQILLYMMRNQNIIIPREKLTQSIWNEASIQNRSNTIDVHIRSLRKKLGAGAHYIKTIHGRGYLMQKTTKCL
jgi:DNA-binding response OmpR family regulator